MITQSCHTCYCLTQQIFPGIILANKFGASFVKDDTGQLKAKAHISMLTVFNNFIKKRSTVKSGYLRYSCYFTAAVTN